MELLYSHVLRRQQAYDDDLKQKQLQIDGLEQKVADMGKQLALPAPPAPPLYPEIGAPDCLSAAGRRHMGIIPEGANATHAIVNDVKHAAVAMPGANATNVQAQNSTVVIHQTHINVFGCEDTSHITKEVMRQIFDQNVRLPTPPAAAKATVRDIAFLIYSDPAHPENLTCFLPDSAEAAKANAALVREAAGRWELRPLRRVLPVVARRTIDEFFEKQPVIGYQKYSPMVKELAGNDAYTGGEDLTPILERNGELFTRLLGELPHVTAEPIELPAPAPVQEKG